MPRSFLVKKSSGAASHQKIYPPVRNEDFVILRCDSAVDDVISDALRAERMHRIMKSQEVMGRWQPLGIDFDVVDQNLSSPSSASTRFPTIQQPLSTLQLGDVVPLDLVVRRQTIDASRSTSGAQSPAYSDDIGIDTGSNVSSPVSNRKQYDGGLSPVSDPVSPNLFGSEIDSDAGNHFSPTSGSVSLYPDSAIDDRDVSFRFRGAAETIFPEGLDSSYDSVVYQTLSDPCHLMVKSEDEVAAVVEEAIVHLQPPLTALPAAGFQTGVTSVTVEYTYETFISTDGRSRRRKVPTARRATAKHVSALSMTSLTKTERGEPMQSHVDPHNSIEPEPSQQPQQSLPRYTCSDCGRHYATSSNLSRHKQTHRSLTGQHARTCPHCDKPYVSMPALAMHLLTHDLKYRCPICDKAFSRPWLLRGHQRSHTGEKPFGCAHCGKAFADRSNLRAHMQTHSTVKNFQCPRCSRQFALKSYLNKHLNEAATSTSSSDLPSPGGDSDASGGCCTAAGCALQRSFPVGDAKLPGTADRKRLTSASFDDESSQLTSGTETSSGIGHEEFGHDMEETHLD